VIHLDPFIFNALPKTNSVKKKKSWPTYTLSFSRKQHMSESVIVIYFKCTTEYSRVHKKLSGHQHKFMRSKCCPLVISKTWTGKMIHALTNVVQCKTGNCISIRKHLMHITHKHLSPQVDNKIKHMVHAEKKKCTRCRTATWIMQQQTPTLLFWYLPPPPPP
jgi:hypothetical protein